MSTMTTKNFAKTEIRRICRSTMLTAIICIGILAAIIYFGGPNLLSLYANRTVPSEVGLQKTLRSQDEFYISIDVTDLFFTGYIYTENGRDKARYYVYSDGSQYILCEMSHKLTADEYATYTITGLVENLTYIEEDVLDELCASIAENGEVSQTEAREWFANVKIDTTRSLLFLQIRSAVFLLAILFCLFKFFAALYLSFDYKKHKAYAKLWKDSYYTAEKISELVTESIARDAFLKYPTVKISKTWVISRSAYRVEVRRTADLIWGYKTVTWHYTNGLPSGKNYAVQLNFEDGKGFKIPAGNQAKTDKILEDICALAPQMMTGYNERLLYKYKGDRAAFAEERQSFHRKKESAGSQNDTGCGL